MSGAALITSAAELLSELWAPLVLSGHFTKHSLRASCATRLFEAGTDEQLIKNVTGHKSDAVWDYKKTNPKLISEAQKHVSATVSKAPEEPKTEKSSETEVEHGQKRKLPVDFNIDDYNLPKEKVSYKVNTEGLTSKCHKHSCCTSSVDSCDEMCAVMKKIDKLSEDRKIKKLHLSLKYQKEKSK